jgi:4-amino-4-deoxy-L-arabinose transferase-like glycosyltransferase
LLPAIAVVQGGYRLAKHFCKRPLLAALVALFTPVFLVSGTTIMCDVLMLAFWVWSVVFWIQGTEQKRPGPFAVAALLMMLAAFTKYFGACLIPLVAAWSIAGKRPVKEWLGWLAIPIAFLIAYQLATRALYGHGLLADAGKYAAAIHKASIVSNLDLILTALSFSGGCFAVVTFFAPFLWTHRSLLVGAGIALAGCGIILFVTKGLHPVSASAARMAQILFWAAGGVSLLALAVADFHRCREANSLLLACWVFGTFIFTAFFNWIVNGRSLLPIAIPAGILLARRLEQRFADGIKWRLLIAPGFLGAALAIWVAVADYSFSVAPRTAARAVYSHYGTAGHRLWFQGHWGFQYYLQKEGAIALDLQHPKMAAGDYIALPSHNANVYAMKGPVTELNSFVVPVHGWLSTMNRETGAGFYASLWGPLPFALGATPPQIVTLFAYDPSGEIQKTGKSQ